MPLYPPTLDPTAVQNLLAACYYALQGYVRKALTQQTLAAMSATCEQERTQALACGVEEARHVKIVIAQDPVRAPGQLLLEPRGLDNEGCALIREWRGAFGSDSA